MCDYMPVEVIIEILKRLPVKSVVRFRSVCKTWNTLFSDLSFISTHLQASLFNNTPFLLLECQKNGKKRFSLHYDNDGFEESKHLRFPSFTRVIGSCNGLICVQLYPFLDVSFNIVLWNPSIQRYIYLPPATGIERLYFNIGFGFDSRTNDYKMLMVEIGEEGGSWIQPYLFSLNKNCWKRVTAVYPNYVFRGQMPLPFVNGAIHLLGYRERNDGGYKHAILGFDLSAEEFFELNLPDSLVGLCPFNLSIMKYGESSIAVSAHPMLRNTESNLARDSSGSDELSGGESDVNLPSDSSGSDELSGGESDVNLPSDSSGSDESSGGESDLA
ncbi:hypothetical protein HRI_001615100 [Hibiscus trionum]|uniref:F-box domain-containing protein n=1 Tax=Hibiscus trionum TaxID=183268 RepID=A0A9W7LWV1_HIBTR|nr:hypothetical protein HRI_001615100 [Hibiscus trionum]